MFNIHSRIIATLTAVTLVVASGIAQADNSSDAALQLGQPDTSIINSTDFSSTQQANQQAINAVQQSVNDANNKNQMYLQQVQQQILHAGSGSAVTPVTSNGAAAPAATNNNSAANPTPTTADQPVATPTKSTSAPKPAPAPSAATGLDTSTSPSDNGAQNNTGGSNWDYGF